MSSMVQNPRVIGEATNKEDEDFAEFFVEDEKLPHLGSEISENFAPKRDTSKSVIDKHRTQ